MLSATTVAEYHSPSPGNFCTQRGQCLPKYLLVERHIAFKSPEISKPQAITIKWPVFGKLCPTESLFPRCHQLENVPDKYAELPRDFGSEVLGAGERRMFTRAQRPGPELRTFWPRAIPEKAFLPSTDSILRS